jgi:hypothetical protein
MRVIISESRINDLIQENFDKIFNKLELVNTSRLYEQRWFDEDKNSVFYRNYWGTLWVDDGCDIYNDLWVIPKILNVSYSDFRVMLIDYLNEKYSQEFGLEQPLKQIGDDYNCNNED